MIQSPVEQHIDIADRLASAVNFGIHNLVRIAESCRDDWFGQTDVLRVVELRTDG